MISRVQDWANADLFMKDINLEAARRTFCGPGKLIPATEMEDLDAQIDDAKASGNRKLKKALRNRYVNPFLYLRSHPGPLLLTPSPPTSRDLTLIKARNDHVTAGLQKAYNDKAPDGHLDVFCVSNTWYTKYSRKGNVELVRGSGIPDLRKFCYGITADAQLREARHFLGRVFGLVNSLELWVGGRLREMGKNKKSNGDGRHNGLGVGESTDGGVWEVVQGVVSGLSFVFVFPVGCFLFLLVFSSAPGSLARYLSVFVECALTLSWTRRACSTQQPTDWRRSSAHAFRNKFSIG